MTFLLRVLLLAVALLATPTLAQSPLAVTGSDDSDMEAVISEARKDGATVVIVRPREAKAPPAMMETMRAERFLAARARLREIADSAASLPEAVERTFENIARTDDGWWWLLKGIGTAGLGFLVAWSAIRPIQRKSRELFRPLYDPDPRTGADRAKYLLFRAVLAVVYATLYFGITLLVAVLLDTGFEPTRRLIFEIALAYFIYRLLRYGVAWNLTAWDAPAHRFVHLDDAQARSIYDGWNNVVALGVVAGGVAAFVIKIGRDPRFGVLEPDHAALVTIALLGFVTVLLIVLTVLNWRGVQALTAPSPDAALPRLRLVLSRLTPWLVIAYAVLAFAASVFRIADGAPAAAVTLVAPFLIAYVALIAYGVVLIVVQAVYERRARNWMARQEAERRAHEAEVARLEERLERDETIDIAPPAPPAVREYRPVLRTFLERAALAVILVVAFGELGRSWGVPVAEANNWWASLLDILLAVALGWIAYRAVCAFVEHRMEAEDGPAEVEIGGEGGGAGASRAATLLPILRWVVTAFILTAAVMIVLSELGIDIAPLIAGAGVIGIAVGFGAQTLIRDVFSGAFFLLDDAFRRGEYIDVEGTKGTVEKISVRSFQLRHHLGALHTIPFGEIRQLTNFSRDWVLMKLPLRVTYDTDVEKVRKLVKKLGQQLLEHPEVGHTFIQPLKSQGVYRMEDSAMIIRVKFMTKPGEQFVTRKVVYAAIQELFAREGIRFAHKEVTVRIADDGGDGEPRELSPAERRAVTAAAREVVDAEEAQGSEPAEADR